MLVALGQTLYQIFVEHLSFVIRKTDELVRKTSFVFIASLPFTSSEDAEVQTGIQSDASSSSKTLFFFFNSH